VNGTVPNSECGLRGVRLNSTRRLGFTLRTLALRTAHAASIHSDFGALDGRKNLVRFRTSAMCR